MLEGKGIKSELAARMAGVRMFSVPPGAYGTNLSGATERSDTWKNEKEVADIYFMRMSHMYGQGFWGDTGQESGQKDVGQELLKNALSGTKMTVHSRSSNVYGLLTGDDPFQSFGGVTMAVRAVDGTSPEVAISNLENVADVKQESLDKYLGREMRTRYLNPEWIKAAQKEGYAGAKMMNETVQNLWGWQVTVPEAVDAAKWNEIFETYVHDRYDLNMEQFFRSSNNLWAYQSLMARMLEAVRKGYWKPSQEVVNELSQRVGTLVQELQEECSEKGCADPILNELVRAELVAVPAMSASPPPVVKPASSAVQPRPQATPSPESATEQVKQVTGRVMEEIQKRAPQPQMMDPSARLWGFLLASLLLAWGFYRARANAPSATNGGRSLWRWGMTRR
jgi:cobaltochelatase CobN